jgi:DNA-directed RNA polymerase subunit omega
MARVTIEDCVIKVNDRFELVAVAAQRAKDIASGAALTIDRKGEKDTVVALREIAEGKLDIEGLREGLVKSYQRKREMEEVQQETSTGEALIAEELAGQEFVAEEDARTAITAQDDADVADDAAFADEGDDEAEVAKVAERAIEGMSFEEDNLDVDD